MSEVEAITKDLEELKLQEPQPEPEPEPVEEVKVEPVVEVEEIEEGQADKTIETKKPKRERTAAQKAVFEKARQKRAAKYSKEKSRKRSK